MNFNERPVNENRMRSRELRSETAANERLAARHNDRGTHHLSEQTKHEKKNLTKKTTCHACAGRFQSVMGIERETNFKKQL